MRGLLAVAVGARPRRASAAAETPDRDRFTRRAARARRERRRPHAGEPAQNTRQVRVSDARIYGGVARELPR